jgi:CheY-like chemotaxis protein
MDLPRLLPRDDAPLPSRRVLLIDDNDDARDLMGMALELHGHQVAMADGGQTGLARASDYPPEIVFLDIGMPVMDGYATAVALRRLPGMEALWIVALSGWGDQTTLARARDAGFDYHLSKPADLARIHDFLRGDWARLVRAPLRGRASPL